MKKKILLFMLLLSFPIMIFSQNFKKVDDYTSKSRVPDRGWFVRTIVYNGSGCRIEGTSKRNFPSNRATDCVISTHTIFIVDPDGDWK